VHLPWYSKRGSIVGIGRAKSTTIFGRHCRRELLSDSSLIASVASPRSESPVAGVTSFGYSPRRLCLSNLRLSNLLTCEGVLMNRWLLFTSVLLATLTSSAFAQAGKLPSSLKVGKQKLVLNGEGSREKYFLDLYFAGLYLAEPNRQAQAVVNADELMAVRIVITSKFVSQEKLVKSLHEGLNQSTGGKLQPIQTEVEQFRQCFSGEIVSGDIFDLVYVPNHYAPNHGVLVLKNGKRQGTVAGMPFKKALFGIWLGERPVDVALREALLGTAATQRR